jgi:flavin reductase (DIM6/NTAB) family NADH-FMN oxidoreductase RutF
MGLLKEGRAFSINVLKKDQLDLADRYGRPAHVDTLMLTEWTTDRLLREAVAWLECLVVDEHPAGDHVLVLGKVFDWTFWRSASPRQVQHVPISPSWNLIVAIVAFGPIPYSILRTATISGSCPHHGTGIISSP